MFRTLNTAPQWRKRLLPACDARAWSGLHELRNNHEHHIAPDPAFVTPRRSGHLRLDVDILGKSVIQLYNRHAHRIPKMSRIREKPWTLLEGGNNSIQEAAETCKKNRSYRLA